MKTFYFFFWKENQLRIETVLFNHVPCIYMKITLCNGHLRQYPHVISHCGQNCPILSRYFILFYFLFLRDRNRLFFLNKSLFGNLNRQRFPISKGQIILKGILQIWYSRILPKSEQTYLFLLLLRICSFVFWENSRTPKSPFAII